MSKEMQMQGMRERLLEMLKEKSFEHREVTLASGRKSNFYIDCRQTLLAPKGSYYAARVLLYAIRRNASVDAVAGVELGGVPPAVAVATITAELPGTPYPALVVRKESKKHGIGAWVEGMKNVPPPAFVALIEDVVTTGGSALVARDKLVGAGYKVPAVFALVDRLEGARKVIEAEGMKLISIFDRHDFIPEEE